jgi:hypothetical protein
LKNPYPAFCLFVGPVALSVFSDLLVAWIAAGRKVDESALPASLP